MCVCVNSEWHQIKFQNEEEEKFVQLDQKFDGAPSYVSNFSIIFSVEFQLKLCSLDRSNFEATSTRLQTNTS